MIATDHKALVSALDENKSNKTYQSRLTRWVDRLLPYQFKVLHLTGKDMGIVDYLSRNPKGEPWPESELDEKFVVTSIESFHKALDCLNSRLSDHDRLDRNENVLEYSRIDKNVSNQNTSFIRCYGNQNGPKRTKHDRNERNEDSRSFQREKFENSKISLSQNRQQIQSVESVRKIGKLSSRESENMHSGETAKRGKEKKMVRIQDRNNTDTLREEITETTFQRTRMIQRTPNRSESENSDFEQIPQGNWNLMNRQIRTDTGNSGQSTSTATAAQPMLVSFWELIGSERNEKPRSTMELEANSVMQSPKPQGQTQSGDEPEIGQIIEVDLTMDSIDEPDYSSGTETCMVTPQQKTRGGHKSRKSNYQLSEQLNETNGPLSLKKLFDKSLLLLIDTQNFRQLK